MVLKRVAGSENWVSGPFFLFLAYRIFLKKLQLLYRFRSIYQFFSPEYLHHPKLLIRDAHNPHMPFGGQDGLYPFYMHVGIFPAGAVAEVNAELEHAEPVGHNVLAEFRIDLPLLFGLGRQVEEY
jgi:hypothetical protein